MKTYPLAVRTAMVVLAFTVLSAWVDAQGQNRNRAVRRTTMLGQIQLPPEISRYPSHIQVFINGDEYRQSTTATPGGTFLFSDLPEGSYLIEVHSPGFENTRTQIRDWSGTSEVTVPLGKPIVDGPDAVPGPGSPTVTVKSLKVPEKAAKLAARAQEESNKQNLHQAVELLQKAVTVCPDYVDAWNNLGVTYLRMHRGKEAESAFLTAVENDSNAVPPLRNLGFLYLKTGRHREALTVLLRAREACDKKDLFIETYLGHAFYGAGRYLEAEAALSEALKIKSDFPAALYPLALAQVKLHEYREARDTFTRFLQSGEKGQEADVARSVLARLEKILDEEERTSAE